MKINDETIIKDDNPLIREKSIDVQLPLTKTDSALLKKMLKYVIDSTDEKKAEKYNLRPAVGISAIQIGIPKKLTAIALKDAEDNIVMQYALANPKIVSESVEKTYLKCGEGCLSVAEEHKGYVYRSNKIKVKGYDLLQDKEIELKLVGYPAIVFQHELDHFKGILYYDRINSVDPFKEDPNAIVIE